MSLFTLAEAELLRFPRWALNTNPVPGTATAEPKLMPLVLVVETTLPYLSMTARWVVPPWSGVLSAFTFSPVALRVTVRLPFLAFLR